MVSLGQLLVSPETLLDPSMAAMVARDMQSKTEDGTYYSIPQGQYCNLCSSISAVS